MTISVAPTYFLTRRIFLISLAVIYFMAFASLAVQILGLVGSDGIIPAEKFLGAIHSRLGAERYWYFPTLFWVHVSDAALLGVCWAGMVLAFLAVLGLAPPLLFFLLWLLYLSLFTVGNVFLGYQWDILLLETGFLAIFFTPLTWRWKCSAEPAPSLLVLWLLRWLLFRLMFQSGLVKWLSADPTWRNLTALEYHYETQPLPTWVGYYAHQFPEWLQKFSCAAMFAGELVAPFFIFLPRPFRKVGCLVMIAFQLLIMLTGNYGFFNLLSIALCFLLLEDRDWPKFLHKPWASGGLQWPRAVTIPLTTMIILLSLIPLSARLPGRNFLPDSLYRFSAWFRPFHLVNGYGLFAIMTTVRREIILEGTMDGEEWKPYVFRWKPGDLKGRPKFVEPHMPRLDWQMWFAALSDFEQEPWFHLFVRRLMEGSPAVLALLKENPFPQGLPKFIRSTIADYRFTDLKAKRETGRWWERGEERPYSPILSLGQ